MQQDESVSCVHMHRKVVERRNRRATNAHACSVGERDYSNGLTATVPSRAKFRD